MVSETHEGGLAEKPYSFTYLYTYPKDWLIEDATKIEIDFNGEKRTLGERTFDSWGRVTSLTRAGITETYSYTGSRTVPDTKTGADGKTLSYEYIKELGNRVSKVSGEDRTQTKSFAYAHGADRRSTASEGETLLAFDHDLHERVTKARAQVRNGTETTVARTWSPAGRLLGEIDANGKAITYEYDAKGRRLRTVAGDLTTSHDYDSQSRPATETVTLASDAVVVSYAYDAFGREEQRRFQLANGFELTIERRYYPDGRLQSTELQEGDVSKGKRSYDYTPLGRLEACETTGAWRPSNPKGQLIDKQIFFYDDLGNVTQSETMFDGEKCQSKYHYDEVAVSRLDRVTHDHADYRPSATLQYDANGRVTRDASGKTYSYDWLGRLTQAGSRYYSYDATDRIATTGAKDQEQQVVYDGLQVRGEYGANGSGRQLEPGSAACTVQRIKRSGVERTLFELRDVDGTVLITYDATAKATKYHAYSAYGEHTSDEGDSLLGFNGEYRDTDNDQYPLGQGYRSYDPTSMRFQSPDDWSPFGQGGPNVYGYGKGDPVNWQDPSGHMAVGSGAVNRGLRARWGNRLPGPLGMGSEGALIGTIIWSALGVLTAIATGGASLLLTAALVGLSIVAAATAITAVIVSDTNPELAAILGWVSLGFTIAGGVTSLAKKLGEFVMKIGRSGMAVARNAYHRIAVAASRLRANGIRSTFRSRTSTYRPSSAEGFGSLEQIDEVRPPARPAGARVFSSIEEGYPVPFDFELPPPEQRSAFLGLMDKVHDTLNIGDINTVVCTVTGVLGNAGYFESEQDAFINGNINNSTWLPWGSFNLGRYGFR
jgi:RHS repeat-associated protein